MSRALSLVPALCLLLVASCAPQIPPTLRATRELRPDDYKPILKLWTRNTELYSGFEHKMTITATMLTPMFRRAFAVRFPEIYGYGSQVTRKELVELGGAAEETLNFVVGVYTPNDRWNDLEKPESIWRLTLSRLDPKTGARLSTVDKSTIEHVKLDENLSTVFPYLSVYDNVYVVRFPVVTPASEPLVHEGDNTLELRVVSSFAEGALTWTVSP
jgi:hypothetical protein